MIGLAVGIVLFDLAIALMISFLLTPAFIGWTIAAWVLIPLTTAIPIVRYFGTLSWSIFGICSLALSVVLLVLYCVLMFVFVFLASVSGNSLAILFVLTVYPTAVVLFVALHKWYSFSMIATCVV